MTEREPTGSSQQGIPVKNDRYPLILAGALLVAAFLRLKGLTFQSMWLDEISTLWYCSPGRSFSVIFDYCMNGEVNPPFFYFLLWIWQKAFGSSELAVRLLPAIAGVLGVAALYLLGRELFSKRAGICAALLAAVMPFLIYYSQEVRAYSLMLLLCTLSYLFLIRILKRRRWQDAAAYAAFTAMMLYTHYYGLCVMAAQLLFIAIWFLSRKDAESRSSLGYVLLPLLSVALACVPWLPVIRKLMTVQSYWAGNPGPWFPVTYFISYFGKEPFVYLASALMILLYLFGRSSEGDFPGHRMLLITWVAVVIALPVIRSLDPRHLSLFHIRYTIVIVPAILLMAGRGIGQLRDIRFQNVVLATILIMQVVNIFFYSPGSYYRQVTKEQWRDAAMFITAQDPEGRYPVYAPPYTEYYFRDVFRRNVKLRCPIASLEDARRCRDEISRSGDAGFWLYEAHIFSDEDVRRYLDSNFRKAEERCWLGARVTLYLPAGAAR